MKHLVYALLVSLLLCSLMIGDVACAEELSSRGRVTYCYDGDTVKLEDGRKVRLIGIDTPEVSHGKEPAQLYASEATSLLCQRVRNTTLQLRSASTGGNHDRYRRLLANLVLPDGSSVNEYMVQQGAAFVYAHKNNDPSFLRKLYTLQKQAIQEGRGMWGLLQRLPIWNARYIGNRNSLRFFPADCPAAHKINPRNRVQFSSLGAAFEMGFAPARICPFWPTVH